MLQTIISSAFQELSSPYLSIDLHFVLTALLVKIQTDMLTVTHEDLSYGRQIELQYT